MSHVLLWFVCGFLLKHDSFFFSHFLVELLRSVLKLRSSLQMALVLLTVVIAAIPVTYCYPAAFEDLQLAGREYHFLFAVARAC